MTRKPLPPSFYNKVVKMALDLGVDTEDIEYIYKCGELLVLNFRSMNQVVNVNEYHATIKDREITPNMEKVLFVLNRGDYVIVTVKKKVKARDYYTTGLTVYYCF
jgi:hypothetical protein